MNRPRMVADSGLSVDRLSVKRRRFFVASSSVGIEGKNKIIKPGRLMELFGLLISADQYGTERENT